MDDHPVPRSSLTAFDLPIHLAERGLTRRQFLKFAALMASTLALPPTYAPVIARAVAQAPRLPVIWLNGQDCAGNTEALLRADKPSVAEFILDIISLEYNEVLMAGAGIAAERTRRDIMTRFPHGYLAVVEGAIPLAAGGTFCTIGGRSFAEIVREVCGSALATIAVGACAGDGGVPGALGGLTGAVGVRDFLPQARVITLPGCPTNPENLTATVVHYLTFGEFPPTDGDGRPLFAYGDTVHEHCPRLPHYRARRFVPVWGDAGHRQGWCLYNLGCRGPDTRANCSTIKFNGGTSWPVEAGHGCIGCTEARFWDTMSPFYARGGPHAAPTPTTVTYATPPPPTATMPRQGTPPTLVPSPTGIPPTRDSTSIPGPTALAASTSTGGTLPAATALAPRIPTPLTNNEPEGPVARDDGHTVEIVAGAAVAAAGAGLAYAAAQRYRRRRAP